MITQRSPGKRKHTSMSQVGSKPDICVLAVQDRISLTLCGLYDRQINIYNTHSEGSTDWPFCSSVKSEISRLTSEVFSVNILSCSVFFISPRMPNGKFVVDAGRLLLQVRHVSTSEWEKKIRANYDFIQHCLNDPSLLSEDFRVFSAQLDKCRDITFKQATIISLHIFALYHSKRCSSESDVK
jgi:hypothetical protein